MPPLSFPFGAFSNSSKGTGAVIPFIPVGSASPPSQNSDLAVAALTVDGPSDDQDNYRTPRVTPVMDNMMEISGSTGRHILNDGASTATITEPLRIHESSVSAVTASEPADEAEGNRSGGSVLTFDFQTSPSSSSPFR